MISKKESFKLLLIMLKIRAFEEKLRELFKNGLAEGAAHVSVGQEAVAAGVCIHLDKTDYVTSNHRGHGHCIAKGASLQKMTAEVMTRKDGISKGRGASMHMYDAEMGILGTNGIVGGGIPIAVGAAFANKYKNKDSVVVCFFGDGASNNGVFHESLNMASIWKLPVIFICENNALACATTTEEACSVVDISKRAEGYGMPSETINGNDLLAVYMTAKKAIDRARIGDGPTLIECKTFRKYGHTVGDPQYYRNPEDLKDWDEKDSISIFEKDLIFNQVITEKEIMEMKAIIAQEMDDAVQFGLNSDHVSLDWKEIEQQLYV